MSNLEYLEEFFKKHNLSGKIKVRYSSTIQMDEYMTDIIFENGDVININDIIFDIESELPEDIIWSWLISKKEKDIGLSDWMQTDTHYIPKDMDTSSVKDFQNEMATLVDDVKKSINTIFELEIDEGDSESEDE